MGRLLSDWGAKVWMSLKGKAAIILAAAFWVCNLLGQLLLAVSYGQSLIGLGLIFIAILLLPIFPVLLPYLAGMASRAHAIRDVVCFSALALLMLLLRPFAEGESEGWGAPLVAGASVLYGFGYLWTSFRGTVVLVSKRGEFLKRAVWTILLFQWSVAFPIILWRAGKLRARAGAQES